MLEHIEDGQSSFFRLQHREGPVLHKASFAASFPFTSLRADSRKKINAKSLIVKASEYVITITYDERRLSERQTLLLLQYDANIDPYEVTVAKRTIVTGWTSLLRD